MKLPELNFTFSGELKKKPRIGNMVNAYVPLQNLITNQFGQYDDISPFTTTELECDENHPLILDIQDSPDGSVNIIINDDKNNPKMINSRFSTQEDNTYIITDHFSNKDTNLYVEKELHSETSLIKNVASIPKIEFLGIDAGGNFKCGSYYFYFKLCDQDGNETDFIGESGLVMCHMGQINSPHTIRMGIENENTEKSVKFKLSNLDGAFDYLIVYYCRTTSGEDGSDLITYHKILNKFPINQKNIELTIYGNEPTQLVDDSEIKLQYYICDAAKTQAISQNRLFLGNITEPYINYELLQQFALHIIPYPIYGPTIGNLSPEYTEVQKGHTTYKILKYNPNNTNIPFQPQQKRKYGYEYYNTINIYYNLGYWPEEFYRFGIVFIMSNNSLSPVFNVRGVDWINTTYSDITLFGEKDICNDDNGFVLNNQNIKVPSENVLGITRMPSDYSLLTKNIPLGIGFQIKTEQSKNFTELISKILKENIKGFFFVRQKRKPIILGQGYLIGKTSKNFGNLPCLKYKGKFVTESFLTKEWDLQRNYQYNLIKSSKVQIDEKNVESKAILMPDAIIRESLYNQIFLGQEFKLSKIGYTETQINKNKFHFSNTDVIVDKKPPIIGTCLNIPSGIKIKTDGESYFSSQAGVAEDVSTFESVLHDWKHEGSDEVTVGQTPPNNFTGKNLKNCVPMFLKQDRLIRGVFGSYVGLTPKKELSLDEYGSLYNIRNDDYDEEDDDWQFKQIYSRKFDYSPYYPISDRMYLKDLFIKENETINNYIVPCFRGDCYSGLFTHRIIRNHIDPEFPTNTKIVDEGAWDNNFLVITKSRMVDKESPTGYRYLNQVIPLFKAMNLYDKNGDSVKADNARTIFSKIFTFGLGIDPSEFTNKTFDAEAAYDLRWGGNSHVGAVPAIDENGEIKKDEEGNIIYESEEEYIDALETVSIVLPDDTRYSKVGNTGQMFGIPNTWYEYGTKNISRSDINSVALGHWLTMRVLSNYNLQMRDVDKYQVSEKVIFNKERGFYPYYPMDTSSEYKLPESKIINGATNLTLSQKPHFKRPETPYIKQQYDTRILYSDIYNGGWKNGFRIFRGNSYNDLPKTYGALVKLVEFSGDLIGVMEHGLLRIPINERVMSGEGSGGSVYINTNNILPNNPLVLSDSIGSIWPESVIKTEFGIYGIDTFTKKIWFTDGNSQPKILSEFKLQKFLNDNIELSEWDKKCIIGFKNVKTHYNAFKKDIIFTFYNDDKNWNLCYNEYLQTFTTFYSWTASYSANINNVFLTFDLNDSRNIIDSTYGIENTIFYKHLHNRLNKHFLFDHNTKQQINLDLNAQDIIRIQGIKELEGLDNIDLQLYDCILNPDNKYIQLTKVDPILQINHDNILSENQFNIGKKQLDILKDLLKDIQSLSIDINPEEITYLLLEEKESIIGSEINYYYIIKEIHTFDKKYEGELYITAEYNTAKYNKTTWEYFYYPEHILVNTKEIPEDKKYLNIKFKSFYYTDFNKITNPLDNSVTLIPVLTSLQQKDVILRLYNSNKCTNEIWKHGQGGMYDGQGDIKPTNWYGQQEPFEFECVVHQGGWVQNLYHNLLLLSNKVKPDEIQFEIIGDSYDWWKYKDIINFLNKISADEDNLKLNYILALTNTQRTLKDSIWRGLDYPALEQNGTLDYTLKTLPYIRHTKKTKEGKDMSKYSKNTTDIQLVEDDLLNEKHIQCIQQCQDIKEVGRIQGNIEYKEDSWWTEIRHINFKTAYVQNNILKFKNTSYSKLRDKYVKIKIKYSGKDLAVIRGISTLLEPSQC